MAGIKSQYWGYTLNNHTAAELILIRNATTVDPIVEHVYTPEKGEWNKPHPRVAQVLQAGQNGMAEEALAAKRKLSSPQQRRLPGKHARLRAKAG